MKKFHALIASIFLLASCDPVYKIVYPEIDRPHWKSVVSLPVKLSPMAGNPLILRGDVAYLATSDDSAEGMSLYRIDDGADSPMTLVYSTDSSYNSASLSSNGSDVFMGTTETDTRLCSFYRLVESGGEKAPVTLEDLNFPYTKQVLYLKAHLDDTALTVLVLSYSLDVCAFRYDIAEKSWLSLGTICSLPRRGGIDLGVDADGTVYAGVCEPYETRGGALLLFRYSGEGAWTPLTPSFPRDIQLLDFCLISSEGKPMVTAMLLDSDLSTMILEDGAWKTLPLPDLREGRTSSGAMALSGESFYLALEKTGARTTYSVFASLAGSPGEWLIQGNYGMPTDISVGSTLFCAPNASGAPWFIYRSSTGNREFRIMKYCEAAGS